MEILVIFLSLQRNHLCHLRKSNISPHRRFQHLVGHYLMRFIFQRVGYQITCVWISGNLPACIQGMDSR